VQIEQEQAVVLGKPLIRLQIINTGTTDAKNVVAYIPLPSDFPSKAFRAVSDPLTVDGMPPTPADDPKNLSVGFTPEHQFVFRLPTLSAGQTAYALLEYPEIDQRGHNITCTVYTDNQQVTQMSRNITP
jgi:hypothetical protein